MVMRNRLLGGAAAVVALAGLAGSASAALFTNGGFESGDTTGWETGGGSWFGGPYPVPQNYFPGSGPITITNAGTDPRTGGALSTVYSGSHSVKVNDELNNYSVAAIRQQVNNYSGDHIAFAYAAVLAASHGLTDSDAFIVTLQDLTTNTTLFSYNLNSAAAPGLFNSFNHVDYGYNYTWYYTPWLTQNIAVTAGHDFMLSLLANDCPYGGHAGYAYLDGFGTVVPPPGPGIPEPATWALMLAGFGLVGATLRSRRQVLAVA
jgi:hypothetical protein